MSVDEDRFKICLQCVGERRYEDDKSSYKWYSHLERTIATDIKEKKQWRNEDYWPGDVNEPDKVCLWCPYVLEHLMIKQDEL